MYNGKEAADRIKIQGITPFLANLVDIEVALGYVKRLSNDKFIDKNLIPWIEYKPDICEGIYEWMQFKIDFKV